MYLSEQLNTNHLKLCKVEGADYNDVDGAKINTEIKQKIKEIEKQEEIDIESDILKENIEILKK